MNAKRRGYRATESGKSPARGKANRPQERIFQRAKNHRAFRSSLQWMRSSLQWMTNHRAISISAGLFILGAVFTYYFEGVLDRTPVSRDQVLPPAPSKAESAKPAAPEDAASSSTGADEWPGGWGPASRATFTIESPSPYIALNSITNNPRHGDERNFVQVKGAEGKWKERIEACAGEEVHVRAYIHNNIAANLHSPLRGLSFRIVSGRRADDGSAAVGVVWSALNAHSVWDGAEIFCPDQSVSFQPIRGSTKLSTKDHPEGNPVKDELAFGENYINSESPSGTSEDKFDDAPLEAGYLTTRIVITAAP